MNLPGLLENRHPMATRENPLPDLTTADPAVSVIIPAYRVATFIREALDSVFAQSFTDFEVIVINDGSPDTAELEQAIESYRGKITYLEQSNQGAGAARNAGLRIARGLFVAFLDGDDIWLPNFLSEQVQLIQSGSGYDLVYADAVNFGSAAIAGGTSMQTNPSEGEVTFESLLTARCNVITSAVVARREPILAVGLFDENFPNSQDFDLWLRLAKHGVRFNYQRKVLVRRRIYAGSLAWDSVKSYGGEVRVLEKARLRDDLTSAERSALESTVKLRQASIELIKAKRSLLSGDFASAATSFQLANEQLGSWKLRLVLIWLRLAPGLLQRCYKLRTI
jgi:glycosyltransferase involved in cell wall biosynthesis